MFGTYRTISLFAATIIIVLFVTKPQFETAQAVRVSIDEYTDTLKSISIYNEKLAGLIRERDALTDDERSLIDTLAGAGEINPAQVIYNLEQVVQRSGLSLDGIHAYEAQRPRSDTRTAVQASIQLSDFTTQDFEITTSGSYAALKSLLNTIEGSLEPYTVVYLKFANERQAALMSYTLRVRVYALASE